MVQMHNSKLRTETLTFVLDPFLDLDLVAAASVSFSLSVTEESYKADQ
jgi:hypothetical protein